MIPVSEIEIDEMFFVEALEALERLPLKCKVSQEHCIILVELDERNERDKSNSTEKE